MAINVKEILNVLQTGELEIEGRIVDASNASLLCNVNKGMKAIYKPIAGERPLWDFTEGSLAARELAAYLVSEAGNFNIVPPTLMRDGPYGFGAVQYWIEVDDSIDVIEEGQKDLPNLRKMAIFDAVINNTDRKFGHLLFTNENYIYGCDHGVCFHEEDKLRTVLWQWSGANLCEDEIANLVNLERTISAIGLSKLLTVNEITALRKRIQRLVDSGLFPTPSADWPAIPWPPY